MEKNIKSKAIGSLVANIIETFALVAIVVIYCYKYLPSSDLWQIVLMAVFGFVWLIFVVCSIFKTISFLRSGDK